MVNINRLLSNLLRPLPPIIRSVRGASLTYIEDAALNDLFELVRTIEKNGSEGIIIEAGCALGGSAIVMTHAKSKKRPLYVYDVFEMIPPPSDKDDADVHDRYRIIKEGHSQGIGGNKYYGYEKNLFDKVSQNFYMHGIQVMEDNVHLVKGLFENTLFIEGSVALAHIDCDWYESVMTCLERVVPHLIRGGVLVIDDYDAWSGCRKAVDDYFRDKKNNYAFIRKSRLQIISK